MIAYTVLVLFLIGVCSSIRVGVKTDKALSLIVFACLLFAFINFYNSMIIGESHTFSFVWNASQGQNLNFDIISNPTNYMLVFPCFVLTLLAILNNLLFRYEERRSAYCSLLIFNLLALILLITSNNFVQLISALFVIDILALFVIKENAAYRSYGMFNMLADMILFMVLAVINARVDSLDLEQIRLYQKTGIHTDFISLSGVIAILIKQGFFGFQSGVLALKNTRFHRMQNVLFLFSPLAALILLIKLNALWRVSAYFVTSIDVMCLITAIWGFAGSVCINEFKAKIIYWMMSFWALMVELLRFYDFVWINGFSALMLEMYVFVTALYLLYYYNNRCNYTTQMMRLRITHKKRLISIMTIILLDIMCAATTLSVMHNPINWYFIFGFSVLFLISTAMVIGQIYFYDGKRTAGVQNDISFKWMVFAELLLICLMLLKNIMIGDWYAWGSAILWVVCILAVPLKKMAKLYDIAYIQNSDIIGSLYHCMVHYLRLCGRLLELLVNHMFLEKIVLGMAMGISIAGLKLFRRLHSSRFFGGTLAGGILLFLLWFSYISARSRL